MAAVNNKVSCMALLAAVIFAAAALNGEAAIDCNNVLSYISPCLPYVTNTGPLGGCCGGVKGLYDAAKSTPDKQSVCSCLKSIAGSNSAIDGARAAGLPGQCGVNIPYKISPSTDCSKVV